MSVGGSASTTISASPEAVYDLVADITRMPQWSPETYRAHWLGGATEARAGAKFRGWNKLGPIRWCTDPVIDAAERGKELTFTTTFFGRGRITTWSYRFEPAGDGTTLTESWSEEDGVLSRITGNPRRAAMLQKGMEQTLERIKAAAEQR